MSWDPYITSLMEGGGVEDAAIIGYAQGQESVWAACQGGTLRNTKPDEVRSLVSTDRTRMFSAGVTVAGCKCTVLRDNLHVDGQNTMDLRTKATNDNPDTYSISISKSCKVIILAKGKKDTPGGTLNSKVFNLKDHLMKSGY